MNRDAWLILYGATLVVWFFGLCFTAKGIWLIFVERPYGPMARWGLSLLIVGIVMYAYVERYR